MGTNIDSVDGADRRKESYEETVWRRRNARMTTVILDKADDGELYAMHGIDLVGHGETAADAAATYCRLVDDRVREE